MEIYCCEEHVNEGLEESLSDEGLPPKFERISMEKSSLQKCFICHSEADYKITPMSS
ncbi:CxxH/CxxC protein [Salipaludibacillus agaradhaerens]|jgi:CxxH/CxxC protein (TIGR04129 family)|uniref:CxxH/CxxC protein n=1 Tax=Salipaludibacillus agaradhaerens TaxID=76935 RepID=A0A9Q4FZI7_SALAG|nr:CxxH/CxxC protein [Salipaludibacillus agaradhaerens]MCR6115857.1 CxxH/CxxC protein [Salipaludibacillus agaradhaerens]